jgi:hypothetical protein
VVQRQPGFCAGSKRFRDTRFSTRGRALGFPGDRAVAALVYRRNSLVSDLNEKELAELANLFGDDCR